MNGIAFQTPAVRRGVAAFLVLCLAVTLGACTPLIADFSLDAYKNSTSLKAETLALVDASNEPFKDHAAEVRAVSIRLVGAYEFARGIPKNEISTKQWELLIDPEGALYGGFLKVWSQQGTTGDVYRAGKRRQIAQAFDYISCLEINKKEAKACSSLASEAPTQ